MACAPLAPKRSLGQVGSKLGLDKLPDLWYPMVTQLVQNWNHRGM